MYFFITPLIRLIERTLAYLNKKKENFEYLNEQPKQSSIHKLADSINRVQEHNWKLK